MITLIVSVAPAKLRGYITRWLYEVYPNVFVGRVSVRVRENLWQTVQENLDGGRAVMTFPSNSNEQGFSVLTHNSSWRMVDFDGLILPVAPVSSESSKVKAGWSMASRRRAASRRRK